MLIFNDLNTFVGSYKMDHKNQNFLSSYIHPVTFNFFFLISYCSVVPLFNFDTMFFFLGLKLTWNYQNTIGQGLLFYFKGYKLVKFLTRLLFAPEVSQISGHFFGSPLVVSKFTNQILLIYSVFRFLVLCPEVYHSLVH